MNLLAKALIKEMIYKALPVGTVRQHKDGKYKKTGDDKWVKVSTVEQEKPSKKKTKETTQDLRTLSDKTKKEWIDKLSKKSLKELRHYQELNQKQLKTTFDELKKRDPELKFMKGDNSELNKYTDSQRYLRGYNNLLIMFDIYTNAIDKREFKED